MKLKMLLLMLFSAFVMQVSAQNYRVSENRVKCVYSDMDGSITVKAVGEGRKKKNAKENARRNAVYAVIFKGVDMSGKGHVNMAEPLVKEIQGEKKYASQLHEFFEKGGKSSDFVSYADRSAEKILKNDDEVIWEFVLRVERAKLLQYLKDEGIVKY